MSRVLGIDLGTTNSAVAVVNAHGVPEIIPNRDGERITASVVFFDGNTPVVGSAAKRSAALNPDDYVQFVKRYMGDPNWRHVTESGEEYTPEEISALILRRLREDAEISLGEQFAQAVITVPAYFSDAQRQATKDAGRIAGLEVPRIINEPTAASLAYGVSTGTTGNVVVYDLGGGTFDVTVLLLQERDFVVLATGGDKNLGGFDWDNEVMRWLNERFVDAGGIDLLAEVDTQYELRQRAEAAKMALSNPKIDQTRVVLSADGFSHTEMLTLQTFEDLTRPLMERTEVILEEVLERSEMTWSAISRVLLVGGSTRMRPVPALIERLSGHKPSKGVNPDEVVALGAAIQGGMIAAETAPAGSRPTIAGGIDLQELTISDVCSHSLGVLAFRNNVEFNSVVLERDTPLPCENVGDYYTRTPNQQHARVRVTQGEGEDPQYVTVIGEAEIALPPGSPVNSLMFARFRYDADGIIHVHLLWGQDRRLLGELRINRAGNLTPDEVEEKRRRLGAIAID